MWGRRLTRESRNLNGVERMNLVRSTFLVLAATALVACERSGDNNDIVDGGIDGGFLRDGVANVWIDPLQSKSRQRRRNRHTDNEKGIS